MNSISSNLSATPVSTNQPPRFQIPGSQNPNHWIQIPIKHLVAPLSARLPSIAPLNNHPIPFYPLPSSSSSHSQHPFQPDPSIAHLISHPIISSNNSIFTFTLWTQGSCSLGATRMGYPHRESGCLIKEIITKLMIG